MKVVKVRSNSSVYTCNAYLVLGTWNSISDINSLIDVGTDGSVVTEIERISTGVGKRPVEQVIITHNHFDHAGGVGEIKKLYAPKVFAYRESGMIDEVLQDGQVIKMGDRSFEVLHVPVHSSDSLCLYCAEDRVLFSGDTAIRIMTAGGSYPSEMITAFEKIAKRDVGTIYPGHDEPIFDRAREIMTMTLSNMKRSGGLQ
jgi:glyoxylase-like metal-dependent hydrolase (beta-lactamase superfamily II)